MDIITSRGNAKIKAARALRQHKKRQQTGLFLVEGIRHVGEAFEAGALLEAIYYAPENLVSQFALDLVENAGQAGIPCYAVSREVFDTLAEKENPQGILAVVKTVERSIDKLDAENFPWGVALVSPSDPGNLGAILRTVDAVGAAGLLALDGGVDSGHPALVRASMGAIFWHPVARATYAEFLVWARHNGYHIYGTSAQGAIDYHQVSFYRRPCILLMGSERQGLSAEQAAGCEQVICLPMRGRATSLNLAIATGVMLYDMLAKLG